MCQFHNECLYVSDSDRKHRVNGIRIHRYSSDLWCDFHLPIQTINGLNGKAKWDKQQNDNFVKLFRTLLNEQNDVNANGIVFPPNVAILLGGTSVDFLLDLSSAEFGPNVKFRGQFRKIDLTGSISMGAFSLANSRISELNLERAIFNGDLVLEQATIDNIIGKFEVRSKLNLRSGSLKQLSLSAASWNEVDLSNARIERNLAVYDATLNGSVLLHSCQIGGSIEFINVTANQDIDITKAQINDSVRIEDSNLRTALILVHANFAGAYIRRSNIKSISMTDSNSEETVIEDAHIERRIHFGNTDRLACYTSTINGDANVYDMRIDELLFSKCKFQLLQIGCSEIFRKTNEGKAGIRQLQVEDCIINGPALFNGRIFTQKASFAKTVFEVAPQFHGSSLPQDTSFSRTKFKDFSGDESARAYRTLRYAMENMRAHQEEGKFFKYEQLSRLSAQETPLSYKLLSLLYYLIADYGQSLLRPIYILAASVLSLFFVYICFAKWPMPIFEVMKLSFGFSVQQAVSPFSAWSYKGDVYINLFSKNFFEVQLIATFQSLLSLSLAALFLVGLRWHFRRG